MKVGIVGAFVILITMLNIEKLPQNCKLTSTVLCMKKILDPLSPVLQDAYKIDKIKKKESAIFF